MGGPAVEGAQGHSQVFKKYFRAFNSPHIRHLLDFRPSRERLDRLTRMVELIAGVGLSLTGSPAPFVFGNQRFSERKAIPAKR
jgi:hypothetical protein